MSRRRLWLLATTCTLFLFCSWPSILRAQSTPNQVNAGNTTGTMPYASYGGVRENINLSTGDLNLRIPLLTLPGRHGRNLTLNMFYDSKLWNLHFFLDNQGIYHYFRDFQDDGFWRFGIPLLEATFVDYGPQFSQSDTACYTNFILTLNDGSKHTFANRASCAALTTRNQIISWPSLNIPLTDSQDSSFIRLDTTNGSDIVAHLKDGTQIHFNLNLPLLALPMSGDGSAIVETNKIEDTEGNTITLGGAVAGFTFGGATPVSSITDTAGRVVTLTYGSGSSTISYKDSNGTTQTITLHYASFPFNYTVAVPSDAAPGSGTFSQLSSITLPNGLAYTFGYNNAMGELSKITYPTGGYTRYDFGTFTNYWNFFSDASAGTASDFREVTAKHVCRQASGSCSTEDTTTYTPTITSTQASNQYMNVVDAANNLTRFQFSGTNSGYRYTMGREITRWNYTGPTATPSALLRTVQTDYDEFDPAGNTTSNSLPIRVTTTLNDSGQVSKVESDFDTYTATAIPIGTPPPGSAVSTFSQHIDNVTELREYSFGAGATGGLARRTDYTWLKTNAVNGADYTTTAIHILDHKLTEQIYDSAGNLTAQSQFEYDKYDTSANHAVLQASGAVQHDSAFGTSYTTRGNVTTAQHWRNTDSTWLSAYSQFDDAGNVLKVIDPGGHTTTFSFSDSWANSACAPGGGGSKAHVTTATNALSQSATSTYNSCSGTAASATDLNSQTINSTYDLMGRLTQTNFPDTGQITRTFNESSMPLSITPSAKITAAANLVSPAVVDGLGRVVQSKLTSDPEGTTYTDKTYDAEGRINTVSNPYRTTSDATYGITTYNYDALSRVVQVIPPDGSSSANNVTTMYSGNCTTVTDQTGKKRKTCADALGRLVQVFEPDANQNLVNETDYQYDVLNNLLCVHQRGTDTTADKACTDGTVPASWHPRKFAYNSLSQLLTSTNPESGTITYTYDADGNVLTKADARSITTTYTYDSLHRVTKKTYSDTTPQVTYWYDGQTPSGCTPPALTISNGIGHRTAMCDAAGSEVWSYDQMGRVLIEKRTTNGVTKTTSYTYNLDGSLATITYPSGRMIIYTPSAAGRILSAVDTANGINYATGALYSPIGAPSSFQNNTNIVSTFYYNNRLQPCRLSVQTSGTVPTQCSDTSHLGNILDLTYGYNLGVADNGNVSQITNNLNANRTQTYSYDEMNRVKTALTQGTSGSLCWGLDYSYDIYANLKTVFLDAGRPSCTWTTLNASVDTNNHITNTGFSYDAAGNVLSDGSFNYTWDAESELKTAAGLTYSYDGDGRRAQKSNGKLYWYGATGDILDESDASGNITDEFVFFGGKRIARRNIASGNIYYYLSDHLGSSRMIMQTGQTSACYDADFDPFGGEHVVTNACPQNYKFTGKERDAETGLDNFEARYYSSQFGRFHSADWSALTAPVPYADLGNPQTLNLYAYVKNNPLNLTDPTGHEPEGVAGQEGGSYIAARRRSHGDNVYGSGEAIDANVWEVTVNGESFFALGTEADALAAGLAQAQAQNQNQNQQNQQQSTAPANSRTDVVLYGREYTPTPQRSTAFLWEMDWYAGSCSGDKCSQSAANQKQTISLVEKVGNGEWKPTGDPIKGVAHDQISPEPKTFNQHWLVDGKQVQLVVGKDSKGNLIKTWEVHVVINKTGDRPVYSPVP